MWYVHTCLHTWGCTEARGGHHFSLSLSTLTPGLTGPRVRLADRSHSRPPRLSLSAEITSILWLSSAFYGGLGTQTQVLTYVQQALLLTVPSPQARWFPYINSTVFTLRTSASDCSIRAPIILAKTRNKIITCSCVYVCQYQGHKLTY